MIGLKEIIIIAVFVLVIYVIYKARKKPSQHTAASKSVTVSKYEGRYSSMTDDPVCPNCGVVLEKFPGRSIKCKDCGKKIIRVKLPDTQKYVILNEKEGEMLKNDIDEEYRKIREEEECESLGVTMDELQAIRKGYGFDALTSELIKEGRYSEASSIYYKAYNYSLDNNDISHAYSNKVNSINTQIMYNQSLPIKFKIKPFIMDEDCAQCKKLCGKSYTLSEFIKTKPIPCSKECTASTPYCCSIDIEPE